jgi:hypothetical protein
VRLSVHVIPAQDPAYRAHGPADLQGLGDGVTVALRGRPDSETDHGRWSGALGGAALRGAEVRWSPS